MSAARMILPQYIYFVYRSKKDDNYYIVRLRPFYRRNDTIYCHKTGYNEIIDVNVSDIQDCSPNMSDPDNLPGFYTHPINPAALKELNDKLNRRS